MSNSDSKATTLRSRAHDRYELKYLQMNMGFLAARANAPPPFHSHLSYFVPGGNVERLVNAKAGNQTT